MRSNCSESLRFRSERLFWSARSPEICCVVYHEYATTAASVTTSPKKRPALGDRSGELCTPRAYNAHAGRSNCGQTSGPRRRELERRELRGEFEGHQP